MTIVPPWHLFRRVASQVNMVLGCLQGWWGHWALQAAFDGGPLTVAFLHVGRNRARYIRGTHQVAVHCLLCIVYVLMYMVRWEERTWSRGATMRPSQLLAGDVGKEKRAASGRCAWNFRPTVSMVHSPSLSKSSHDASLAVWLYSLAGCGSRTEDGEFAQKPAKPEHEAGCGTESLESRGGVMGKGSREEHIHLGRCHQRPPGPLPCGVEGRSSSRELGRPVIPPGRRHMAIPAAPRPKLDASAWQPALREKPIDLPA